MALLVVGTTRRPVHKSLVTSDALVARDVRVYQDVSDGASLVLELLQTFFALKPELFCMPYLMLSQISIRGESSRADITDGVFLFRVQGLVSIPSVKVEEPFGTLWTSPLQPSVFCVLPLPVEIQSCRVECLVRANLAD